MKRPHLANYPSMWLGKNGNHKCSYHILTYGHDTCVCECGAERVKCDNVSLCSNHENEWSSTEPSRPES